jgi:hypothetical protein
MQSSLPIEVSVARGGGPTDPAHDERLRLGIIDTAISRPVAVTLTALFLAVIYLVPIGQAVMEKVKGEDSPFLELFRHVPTRESLQQFEKDLEQASYPKDFVQPRVQLLLTQFGRVGNKRAVIGSAGWLYYAPGITHLAGPSFVDADAIKSRELEAENDGGTHADPRPAVLAFSKMLSERGIKLVLFPVPDKAMLQPIELHGRVSGAGDHQVPRNVGWERFLGDLQKEGVAVFDPAPARLSPTEKPRFLEQDTHWTPEWMETVARDLARYVERVAALPRREGPFPFRAKAEHIERVGDLVDMLKLPEGQSFFRPQSVTIHTVADAEGNAWESDAEGDVLLLGDSFTNIYSMDPMGWGTAAGLAPQLSLALGRPVDVIAQNDSGAFATRQALGRELAAGEERLAKKKVVIWEFASRELSVGNWKPVDWRGGGSAHLEGTR